MSEDRSGIDRLRAAIDEIAAGLPPPGRPRRTPGRGGRVGTVAAAAALVVIAAAIWGPRRGPDVDPASRLGVEVKTLRVGGRDVTPRVFEAASAGTIVVAPQSRSTIEGEAP